MAKSALTAPDGARQLIIGPGGIITADRVAVFDVDSVGGNVVTLRDPATGRYWSALDEATCAARGLPRYSVTASADYADIWERWTVVPHMDGIALQSHWGTFLSVQHGGGGAVLVDGPTPGPWEPLLPSNPDAFPMSGSGGGGGGDQGDGTPAADPLVGSVRVQGRSFADDTGPRIVHGVSDFAALVKYHENRDQCCKELDAIAASGRQYIRVLFRLNGWYWTDSGLTVDPCRDSWYDDALRGYLTACRDRGLRVNLTSGDMNNWTDAQMDDGFTRTAQIAASVDPQLVWLAATCNEMRGVWGDGETDEHVRRGEDLMRLWASHYPGSLRSNSDPGDQAKDGMIKLSGGNCNVALMHDVRWHTNDAIRRAFNTRYENDPGKPVVQDEPTGPNGSPPAGTPYSGLVYQPIEDPGHLLAIYTMHVLTGQASTYFNDPALVSRQPIDSTWGVWELPALWRQMGIPQNIGQGQLKPGHHADAPLRVKDSHAERADSMVIGGYALGVISGGSGWDVKSGWDGTATTFGPVGPTWEGRVSVGQSLPCRGPDPVVVRIVR